MNKFLADIQNFSRPIQEYTSQIFKSECEGVTLGQARKIGNAVAKLEKAAIELTEIIYYYDADNSPLPSK